MKRTSIFLAAAALGLSSPVYAQDEAPADEVELEEASGEEDLESDADPMAQAMEMLSGMFDVEPLTPEQEARLPQARRIIEKMIPDGTMAEMMGTMFDDMLGPIMAMGPQPSTTTVAEKLGVTAFELSLTDEHAAELATMFDPAWKERHERELALFPDMMAEMMALMEPGMRKAMSELYAINFSDTELSEIEAFFSTETGAAFARKSFAMASDPRVMGASMEMLPAMMGAIGDLEKRMEEATADLPAERSFSELSDAEKARIVELTGYSKDEIEQNVSAASFSFDDWSEDNADAAAEEAADEAEAATEG